MFDSRLLKKFDYSLFILIAVMLVFSTVILYSATQSISTDPFFYIKKQLLFILLGIIGLFLVININYSLFASYQWHLYLLNLLLLASVLLFGKEVNGAKSWIDFGSFYFQPSEFSKILIVLSFAQFLNTRRDKLNSLLDLLPCFAYFFPPMLLIMAQPDLGSALVFLGILFGMVFVAGARPGLLAAIGSGVVGTFIGFLMACLHFGFSIPYIKEYQVMRIIAFLNPYEYAQGAGYQLVQSLIAVGSGGIWGTGLRQGSQVQLNFLPYHHTDFIFSVVGEELGFVGGLMLLLLYFLLVHRLIQIAMEAKDVYGTLIVTGVASILVFHVLVNIGMTIGIMPITGIPLPLFSYGGSNMLATLLALGLAFNVSMRKQKILF